MTQEHLPRLDGLRGLAILMVVIHHVLPIPSQMTWAEPLRLVANAGWIGVDLFFVLSGFLITRILVGSRTSTNYFRNFYMRRVLRIFPLYYAYLLAYFFLVIKWKLIHFDPARTAQASSEITWVSLYTTNFIILKTGAFITASLNHLWSLAVEEHFYLFWPAIIYFLPSKYLERVCLGGILLSVATRIAMLNLNISDNGIYTFTASRLDGFFVGALVFTLSSRSQSLEWIQKYSRNLTLSLASILALGAWQFAGLNWSDLWMKTIGFSLLALFFGALLAQSLVIKDQSRLAIFFSSKLLKTLGKYSYGIYVFHFPIQIAVERALPTALIAQRTGLLMASILHVTLVLALTTPTVLLSWYFWERPFLSLKGKFETIGTKLSQAEPNDATRLAA